MNGVRLLARSSSGTHKYDLDKEEIVIGRDKSCDVSLEEATVSRKHARIAKDVDGYRIEDLGSTAGTYVNEKRVEQAALAAGDRIAIGEVEIMFYPAGPGLAEPTLILPIGTQPERSVTAAVATQGAALMVIKGDDRNRVLNLSADELPIGRDETCAIYVNDRYMSRRHAKISKRGAGYALTDLGSSNGTFLNGRLVKEAKLTPGDEIKLGSTVFRFQVEGKESLFRGLSGRLELFLLLDLLQLLNIAGRTGRLHLSRDGGEAGELFFEKGEIVDARIAGQVGVDAALALFAWDAGDFRFESDAFVPAQKTIASPADLMERALRLVERGRRH